MTRKAAKTGPGAMVLVAIEQGFSEEDRIINDPLAYAILPLGSRIWVRLTQPIRKWIVAKTEEKVPGLWGGIMARKRFIDDAVAEAVSGPIESVVNLGAGFDTRAFRMPELAGVLVWEVDQPGSIDDKRHRLQRVFGEVPANVTLVPMDFDREDLGSVLASHGYLADKETFFIWEGVTQYLTEAGIRKTFDFLGSAPKRSRLVFTYTPKDFIDGRVFYGHEFLYEKMRVKDTIWNFGINPDSIDGFLGDYGWRLRKHQGYEELGEQYVGPTGRDLSWMAIERIVEAEKI